LGNAKCYNYRDRVSCLETGSFGYWLKRRRKALDLTQTALARRAKCATATIRKIEADERKPSPELAGLLADALEISPQERSTFFQAVHDVRAVERLLRGDFAKIVRPVPNNLPAPLTSFINRVQDNATVVALLTREDVRLLTLTGLPGIGKTRLSISAAENLLEHFQDGVWFVELAAVTEPALVLPAIMRVLDIAESGPQTPLRQLTSALQGKRVLLVLDNFEQVLDAATEVAELLKTCRGLKVLVTSRVPLHLYGEHAYVLPPMSLPEREQTPSQLVQAESAQLFMARVKEHQPRFAITAANAPLIAEVCVRLEGVPLALELAAASLRLMTLEQLVQALSGEPHWLSALRTAARDLPPRQQTLYNALAWSYGLLGTGTQQVFRPLGVLRGGFDLSAASAVCGLDEHLVGNALAELTDQHLLAHDGTRWRMLEMIREFAQEQMAPAELALAEERHARYFAARLNAPAPLEASFIEPDHANFLAALEWACRQGDAALALTMGRPLADFWETRGYLLEGLEKARAVLRVSENAEPGLRLSFLNGACHLAWNRHDFAAALEFSDQSIALAKAHRLGLAWALNTRGRIFIEQGDYARAEQTLRECLQTAKKTHEEHALGLALTQLGELALALGKLDEAQKQSLQGLEHLDKRVPRFLALAHTNLAEIALLRGDGTTAQEHLQLALPHIHSHVRRVLCFFTTLAGWCATRERVLLEDARCAAVSLGVAAGLTERTGAPLSALYRTLQEKRCESVQQRLTNLEWQGMWYRGYAMSNEQAVAFAGKLLHTGSA